ncbi:MAG TPA: PAS domain-containing protein [Vicinamibacterales bacterium]|nr:PAS domain-containing protein [Vicinamibacterales bacterium]
MIHVSALDQVMKTLTEEARASLSSATPQIEAVRRLEEVVRVHPYAVLFADNTGRYIGANPAASELTGYSRRELLSSSVFDITPPVDEKDITLLWRAFLRTGRQGGDIVIHRRDGTEISGRYMAVTNVIPGVHVSVLAKI